MVDEGALTPGSPWMHTVGKGALTPGPLGAQTGKIGRERIGVSGNMGDDRALTHGSLSRRVEMCKNAMKATNGH